MDRTYALSIKQPWAALVVAGVKSIEVRTWPTRIRGRVLIHAARLADERPEGWHRVTDDIRELAEPGGGIIGAAELIDCVPYRNSVEFTRDAERHLNDPSWFQARGMYGFVFRCAAAVPFRRLPGNVRFFRVEEPR
jgi:hypothetical protein